MKINKKLYFIALLFGMAIVPAHGMHRDLMPKYSELRKKHVVSPILDLSQDRAQLLIDAERIVAISHDGIIQIWNSETNEVERQLCHRYDNQYRRGISLQVQNELIVHHFFINDAIYIFGRIHIKNTWNLVTGECTTEICTEE